MRKKTIPSDKPVVLRPSETCDVASVAYSKRKTETNKKIASHKHRSRNG